MKIMLTTKAQKAQIVMLILSILSVFAILFLKVEDEALVGGTNILSSWSIVCRGIPIFGIMLTIIFFFCGLNMVAFLMSFIFSGFSVINTVMSFEYDELTIIPLISLLLIDLLSISFLAICLLVMVDKNKEYSRSYILEIRDAIPYFGFSLLTSLSYYLMNLKVQEFYATLFDAFDYITFKYSLIVHAIVAILMITILFLLWRNDRKKAFGIEMALSLLLIIMLFINLNPPYRTANYYIILFITIIRIVLISFIFKSSLAPNIAKKKAELDLLLNNNKISQQEYEIELQKINQQITQRK